MIHAINSTAGSEGLASSVLVFGTIPRLPLPNTSSMPQNQVQRFEATKLARTEWKQSQPNDEFHQLFNTVTVCDFIPPSSSMIRSKFGVKISTVFPDRTLYTVLTMKKQSMSWRIKCNHFLVALFVPRDTMTTSPLQSFPKWLGSSISNWNLYRRN